MHSPLPLGLSLDCFTLSSAHLGPVAPREGDPPGHPTAGLAWPEWDLVNFGRRGEHDLWDPLAFGDSCPLEATLPILRRG